MIRIADGSVRFLKATTSLDLMLMLLTRDRGEGPAELLRRVSRPGIPRRDRLGATRCPSRSWWT